MGTIDLSKFSSQANPEILSAPTPNRQVLAGFAQSLNEFEALYKEFAK